MAIRMTVMTLLQLKVSRSLISVVAKILLMMRSPISKVAAGQMMLNRMRKMVRQGSSSLEMKGRNHRMALLFRSFRRFS